MRVITFYGLMNYELFNVCLYLFTIHVGILLDSDPRVVLLVLGLWRLTACCLLFNIYASKGLRIYCFSLRPIRRRYPSCNIFQCFFHLSDLKSDHCHKARSNRCHHASNQDHCRVCNSLSTSNGRFLQTGTTSRRNHSAATLIRQLSIDVVHSSYIKQYCKLQLHSAIQCKQIPLRLAIVLHQPSSSDRLCGLTGEVMQCARVAVISNESRIVRYQPPHDKCFGRLAIAFVLDGIRL